MAGRHNRDRILRVRAANGAGRARLADLLCNLPIGTSLAIRNREQRRPNLLTEGIPNEIERHVERSTLAGEVFIQLALDVQKNWVLIVLGSAVQVRDPPALVGLPQNARQTLRAGDQP